MIRIALLTLLAAPLTQAADVSQVGLPTLSCINQNYRDAELKISAKEELLELRDTMTTVSDAKLLDEVTKTPGLAKKVKGFRVKQLDPQTDSCRHVIGAPFLFTCSYQFATAELIDGTGKTLATTGETAFITVRTSLTAWEVVEEQFEIEAELSLNNGVEGVGRKFTRVKARSLWFSAQGQDAHANCKFQ